MDEPAVVNGARPVARPPVPGARALRRRIRGVRSAHHSGALADLISDAYIVALVVALYGWGAASGIRRHLATTTVPVTDAAGRYWIAVAAAMVAAGLAWQALRVLGPLLVTPATQTWVFSSPVDRRDLLLPRFWVFVVATAVGIGLLGLAAGFAGGAGTAADLIWSAGVGAACGGAGAALGVVAQAARRAPRWAGLLGGGLVVGGIAVALVVIAGQACRARIELCGSFALSPPWMPLTAGATLVLAPVAVYATIVSGRALVRIDRAGLTAGAELAGAAASAAIMLDPSMLSGLVESRRWRAVARVPGRPLAGRPRPGRLGRWWWPRRAQRFQALVRADLRRRLRDRFALRAWGGLILAIYAVAVALPTVEGSAHLILAYLAADRLTGGLRAISRSPGLRRSLGGSDRELRLAHLVVPALGTIVWYLVTVPPVGPLSVLDVALLPGVVLAAYRAATRRPRRYGGVVVDTPLGMIPIDMISQVIRGPDLVAVLVLAELLLR